MGSVLQNTCGPVLGGDGSRHDTSNDDVCIVGMACRLPGGITSPSSLWDFLMAKRSAQGPVPSQRFNGAGFYSSEGSRAGTMPVSGGYFIQGDIRNFDNSFFGISNLEAMYLDPQQRKLLEIVFECFEHAGVSLDKMSGTSTGVYVGSFTVDYQTMQTRDIDSLHRYTATGAGTTILANRISHAYNLQGPSVSLDTACSSSLYALHQAVSAIKAGDCDGAIVAGVNLILGPEQTLGTSKAGVLSPTSTCHTFHAGADGYGRGDGVNAIYLKPLSAAKRDGDKVWGVIRGTSVNANGTTPGITQPSADLQEKVIRKAYTNARLDPTGTCYVECHGTGTPIGDPIEVDAVSRCFSRGMGDAPLLIGSSKPNLGHSEASSGLTSLIKVALALNYGIIPPTCGVENLNPKLLLEARNMKVVTESTRWPTGMGMRRIASVNSFGYGGANAHAILEGFESSELAPILISGGDINHTGVHEQFNGQIILNGRNNANGTSPPHAPGGPQVFVVPVSAASAKSLRGRVQQTKQCIQDLETNQGPAALEQFVQSLCERKTHFTAARHALLFQITTDKASRRELQFIEPDMDSTELKTPSLGPLPFSFVFTGQGAQYHAMAKGLLLVNGTRDDRGSSFLSTIRSLDAILQALPSDQAPSWTLEETILDTDPATSQVHNVTRSQPLCTAIQIALVDMLNSWGVHPSRVVGHSSGEIAAAYAAGLMTAEQAFLVAYYRGLAVGSVENNKAQGSGTMLAAGVDVETAEKLIQDSGLGDVVTVGCINSPKSVTLSGSAEGIKAMLSKLQDLGKFARELRTGGRAYHSFMMREVGAFYETLLGRVFSAEHMQPQISKSNGHHEGQRPVLMISSSSRIADVSSLTTSTHTMSVVDRSTATSAKYWRHNLEQPVHFYSAMRDMLVGTRLSILEIGPHPALKGPIEQTRAGLLEQDPNAALSQSSYFQTLNRAQNPEVSMKELAGSLFVHRHHLQWRHVNNYLGGDAARSGQSSCHYLPPYPWDYSGGILWHEPRASVETRQRMHPCHELLGSLQVAGNGIDWMWRKVLILDEVPWLRDHKVESRIVFPAAGYLSMIIEAFCQRVDHSRHQMQMPTALEFQAVNISAALMVPDDDSIMQKNTELHTSLSPRRLSTSAMSAQWYDFSISSWVAGDDGNTASMQTLHCAGRVCATTVDGPDRNYNSLGLNDMNGFTEWSSMANWYDKFAQQGLCYGPEFQAITELRSPKTWCQTRREVICRTRYIIAGNQKPGRQYYPVHPITLDTCLQTAILSASAGDIHSIRAYLPEFIDRCVVRLPSASGPDTIAPTDTVDEAAALILSRVTMTGVSTARLDCSLLSNQDTSPTVQFQSVKMSEYTAKSAATTHPEQGIEDESSKSSEIPRQPCLQVQWKPDIDRCFPPATNMTVLDTPNTAAASYIASFVQGCRPQEEEIQGDSEFFFRASVAAVLDLVGHKNPRMRVLEVVGLGADADGEGGGDRLKTTRDWWQSDILGRESGFRRYSSWQVGTIKQQGDGDDVRLEIEPVDHLALDGSNGSNSIGMTNGDAKDQGHAHTEPFDLVIFSTSSQVFREGNVSTPIAARFASEHLVPRGMIILTTSSSHISQGGFGEVRVSVPMPCGEQFVLAEPARIVSREEKDDDDQTNIEPAARRHGNMDTSIHVVLLVRNNTQTRSRFHLPSGSPSTASVLFADPLSRALHIERPGISTVDIVPFDGETTGRLKTIRSDGAALVCISLLELEDEILASLNGHDLPILQEVLQDINCMIWITGANMLGSGSAVPNPNLTLSSGLSRSLALEQPTLGFSVLDIGAALHTIKKELETSCDVNSVSHSTIIDATLSSACRSVASLALHCRNDSDQEREFIWSNGLLHISRFVPDQSGTNQLFCRRLGLSSVIQPTPLHAAVGGISRPQLGTTLAHLALSKGVGITQGMHFQQVINPRSTPLPTSATTPTITIRIQAVGLNAKDIYSLHSRVETRTGSTIPTILDYAGTVTSSSSNDFAPGDQVVVGATATQFATHTTIPSVMAHRLLPHEEFTEIVTVPVVYATALYALRDMGRIELPTTTTNINHLPTKNKKSVLVHGGAGALGLATIAMAQHVMGISPKDIYTTAGSLAKRAFVAKETGLSPSNILDSRDAASFVEGIRAATGGRGVDVVVNSLTGDSLHAGWEGCLAPFGRFVEVGKKDLVDGGRLDMRVFRRNATFVAFDLSDLYFAGEDELQGCGESGRRLLSGLVAEVLELYRTGVLPPIPKRVFAVGDVAQAYRYFSHPERVGKVVISLEEGEEGDGDALIPLALARYRTVLDSGKVYLLVGGLGGLGRSLSRWMLERGARNLVFLGRTGCEKPSARALVEELESIPGTRVAVVKGDVSEAADVQAAVDACRATGHPIGGIVHGAMALRESLFSRMSAEKWQTAVRPKWAGAWNLHNAVSSHDSDDESLPGFFFLLMSSVSGSVGTATESNYCAANGFLDAFARWRRSQGKPAVSVGLGMISEVGYLHENPEIEALLLRRGIQPLNEEEFLQLVDLALTPPTTQDGVDDTATSAHLLSGLETFEAQRLRAQGFDVQLDVMNHDPRASVLAAAYERNSASSHSEGNECETASAGTAAAPWFQSLMLSKSNLKATQSLAAEAHVPSLQAAILSLVLKRFSSLMLMPVEQIDLERPLARFGVDSMTAAEFRTWFWTALRTDIPFLDLMSTRKTLVSLADFVAEGLRTAAEQGVLGGKE